MIFEVKDGSRRLFWTECPNLIPDKQERKQLRAAGLRLLLDGKPFSEKENAAGGVKSDMRFWVVHRYDTEEAIFEAIRTGQCKTEADVEAIAERFNDHVAWASNFASGLAQEDELEQ